MDNLLFRLRFSLRRCCDKGLQFLTPNFKSHPLNYVFAVVFFVLGFVPTSAFATTDIDYQSYSSSSAAFADCKHFADSQGSNCFNDSSNNYWSFVTPSGSYRYKFNYINDVDPTPDCPEAGTKYTLGFAPVAGSGFGSTIGNKKSLDGCTLVPKNRTVDCFDAPEGSLGCLMMDGYEYTGESDPVGEPSPPVVDPEAAQPVDIPETEPLKDGKNLAKETTETIIQDTVTETMPDGTVVKQDVTTTISTKGKGTDIETTTEQKKIVRDNGITKTQTTTTTTTTNPDGSKSIVTETDTSYEQSDKELIIVKNADGSISIVKNEGYKGSSKTKNTKNFDAEGKKTSETEEKEQAGEEEENTGKFCEDNPELVDCKEKGGSIDGGFYEPAGVNLEDVFNGFKTKLDQSDIGDALGGFYEISVGATCPRWAVDVWVFQFDLDQMCSPMMVQALGWAAYVILAAASFLAFRIAFL